MAAEQDESQVAPLRGVVGRAASTSMFDLDRWPPSESAGRFVEHLWSVSWDLRGQEPLSNTVITFPSLHITHEWGTDGPRHGFVLPSTLVHGVVERVFRTTIGERGTTSYSVCQCISRTASTRPVRASTTRSPYTQTTPTRRTRR
jgi:hypothetical protein